MTSSYLDKLSFISLKSVAKKARDAGLIKVADVRSCTRDQLLDLLEAQWTSLARSVPEYLECVAKALWQEAWESGRILVDEPLMGVLEDQEQWMLMMAVQAARK